MSAMNNDVLGRVMFEKAQKEYPYLAGKDIAFAYNPRPGDRQLEFYSPEETERPKQIPAGRVGLEVYKPTVKPLDILGDYVSHYAVQNDPRLKEMYARFQSQLDPKEMQRRYEWHKANAGETRPYEEWYRLTGLPEVFRGYTFNQWPEDFSKRYYSPEQMRTLNEVRSYLSIK